MLKALRNSSRNKALARRLCAELMRQAREPVFFLQLHVPDTMDGRFDLVALHAWLVLECLKTNAQLAQALIDDIFLSFDEALRATGTGDIGMNRHLETMAGAFYGRLQAYRSACDPDALTEAIHRNLYRGADGRIEQAQLIARYAMAARSRLDVAHSPLNFGPLTLMLRQ